VTRRPKKPREFLAGVDAFAWSDDPQCDATAVTGVTEQSIAMGIATVSFFINRYRVVDLLSFLLLTTFLSGLNGGRKLRSFYKQMSLNRLTLL